MARNSKLLRTPLEAALVLGVIATRSGKRFARVGKETLKLATGRKKFAESYLTHVKNSLYDVGFEIITVSQLTWILIKTSQVESASRTVTAKRWLTDDERDALAKGLPLDFDELEDELDSSYTDDGQDEEDEA